MARSVWRGPFVDPSLIKKVELLKECGVIISKNPSVMGQTIKSVLNGSKEN